MQQHDLIQKKTSGIAWISNEKWTRIPTSFHGQMWELCEFLWKINRNGTNFKKMNGIDVNFRED